MRRIEVSHYVPAIERLSRDEILALQWKKLKYQLEYLYQCNPFYRRKFEQAGLTPDDIRSLRDFRRFPLSTKAEFMQDQEEQPPFGARLGVPCEKVATITSTGGTSGLGTEIHAWTARDLAVHGIAFATLFYWCGLRPSEIGVFNVGLGNHTGGWILLEAVKDLGRAPYLIGHLSFGERLAHMQKYGVQGMWAIPSALNALTVLCREGDIDPKKAFPDLKFILIAAEAYPISWATRMEEFWGARICEDYGSTQAAGVNIGTCEYGAVRGDGQRGLMHFLEWDWLHEVINPETGEDVQPGEPGELVLTCLEKEASPVLRFSTRDRVTWLPHNYCPCGRAFAGIEAGTVGRYDDMMKVKATNFWPAQVDSVVFAHDEIEEYQGRVYLTGRGRDEIEVTVALKAQYGHLSEFERTHFLERLAGELKATTELRMTLRAVERKDLPVWHTPERKARRWIDERQKQMAEGD